MNSYDNYGGDPSGALAGMMGAMGIVYLLIIAFFIFCWWRIFSKAGHSGWLSLLLLVPLVNLFVFLWFVFSEWPVQKQLRGGPKT